MTAPLHAARLLAEMTRERRALAAVARREGLAPEDAFDCVQDGLCTFLQLASRGEISVSDGSVRPYLTGIIRNAARNRRRRHHLARPHAPLRAIDLVSPEPGADALVSGHEEQHRVQACVALLNERQRAVVMRRLLDERDGEDVAAELGLTRGHVDVLLHRAKQCLRACLGC
jgi:RNA polymerase sigma-70 factor (ECF subfamily)